MYWHYVNVYFLETDVMPLTANILNQEIIFVSDLNHICQKHTQSFVLLYVLSLAFNHNSIFLDESRKCVIPCVKMNCEM